MGGRAQQVREPEHRLAEAPMRHDDIEPLQPPLQLLLQRPRAVFHDFSPISWVGKKIHRRDAEAQRRKEDRR
jgi:hypothetical protein